MLETDSKISDFMKGKISIAKTLMSILDISYIKFIINKYSKLCANTFVL